MVINISIKETDVLLFFNNGQGLYVFKLHQIQAFILGRLVLQVGLCFLDVGYP